MGLRIRGDGANPLSILFPNGSRIVSLPGKEATNRCFSAVSLLIFDEAARVPDALYKALRPTLATSAGDLWLMSTPYGKRGFFYEKWAYGNDRWYRLAVPATDCPRISREFLEEERDELGDLCFRQEYLCEFIESGSGLFDWDLVEDALDETLSVLTFN